MIVSAITQKREEKKKKEKEEEKRKEKGRTKSQTSLLGCALGFGKYRVGSRNLKG